jgi:exodeoxyribonuclease VII small subunit
MPLSPKTEGTGGRKVADSAAEPRSFEAAFDELQGVVEQLEDGGLDLEAAIRAFERGTRLAQLCERIVDDAEQRVTRLSAESASPLADA